MKKYNKMLLPVVLPVVIAGALIAAVLLRGEKPQQKQPVQEGSGITVLDADGNTLIASANTESLYQSDYWAYLDVVVSQATEKIAEIKKCDQETALNSLFSEGYVIQTPFRADAYRALQAADAQRSTDFPIGCALTDLDGKLLAVYSTAGSTNYALQKVPPYSSFKPLSVYAPAVEAGIVHWSSQYEDSAYKKWTSPEGEEQDWPANFSKTYQMEDVSVYEALQVSLNTVAVKCLADVKVSNSIAFLQEKLGIPLTEEAYSAKKYGEEEVIGNIAMGYLETGVTPVDMAGYYQIFANGGIYTPSRAILKISTRDGQVLYGAKDESCQAIKPETADVMNKLLQGVVKAGGTGAAAACKDVAVAGKTGTGEEKQNYWFVGVTPGYSLAVWHGENENNRAAEIFAAAVEALYKNQPNANRNFITHKNLQHLVYCADSGMLMSINCSTIEEGYYSETNTPGVCDQCPGN